MLTENDLSQQKSNILFIYADDVGFGDIGSYGAEQIQVTGNTLRQEERSDWAYNRHNLGNIPLNVEPLDSTEYLFNLEEDPEETENLINEYPDRGEEMQKLLDEIKNLL